MLRELRVGSRSLRGLEHTPPSPSSGTLRPPVTSEPPSAPVPQEKLIEIAQSNSAALALLIFIIEKHGKYGWK